MEPIDHIFVIEGDNRAARPRVQRSFPVTVLTFENFECDVAMNVTLNVAQVFAAAHSDEIGTVI